MRAFLSAIFEWIFGCHDRQLSRVFTIDHKTYQVCFDCGRKLQYSWRAMSPIKTNEKPQTLVSNLVSVALTPDDNTYLWATGTASRQWLIASRMR